MSEFLRFLKEILPSLVDLAETLFDKHDGDVELAQRDIKDLRPKIADAQAERDRELEAKHRDPDRDTSPG